MDSDIIQLRYLPLFYEDMEKVVDYIAYELRNPQAANDLIDAAEKAILERVRRVIWTISIIKREKISLLPYLCEELCCLLCDNQWCKW